MSLLIKKVSSQLEINLIKELFQEYESLFNSRCVDICFQNFDKELDSLPGEYSEPEGAILIAFVDDKPAGCIALKKLEDCIGEMKRLYVKPEYRNIKLGKILSEKIIQVAKQKQYKKMRLDTVPKTNTQAFRLYQFLGFKEIDAYYSNPGKGITYMELVL